MMPRVLMADEAVGRLAELGLSIDLVERVVRQADAEASFCTPLDPPIMEGLTRWARTNRFLREELIPLGWRFDNPRNLPRTIHPGGQFAIVATTGDDVTGLVDLLPAPKYAKGYATTRAVEVNEQLTLDFGDFDLGRPAATRPPADLAPAVPQRRRRVPCRALAPGPHRRRAHHELGRADHPARLPAGRDPPRDGLASPDSAGDRGIVVEVSPL